jgi:hypothetical protein
MSENELREYLFDEEIGIDPEMRWHNGELLIFLYYFQIEDFIKALNVPGLFDDGGVNAVLKDRYMVFDLVPFCESLDIDPERILAKGVES